MPFFKLYETNPNQAVDIAPYIEEMKWSENDLDSPDAGRDLSGEMHRGKVASKRRCDLKLISIDSSTAEAIFRIIRSEYFWCETDLIPGSSALSSLAMKMYNSTRSGGILIVTTDMVVKHKDVAFNVIQQ